MSRLKFEIVPIKAVSRIEQETMFGLFTQYYDLPEPEQFYVDFQAKDDVIILRDKITNEIKGFSTQLNIIHTIGGKDYHALFSGDTIIDKSYWGESTLNLAFCWYLARKMWQRPWRPVYWHLISKGYKTYLLLAHNFTTFYPRYNKPTPPMYSQLMDRFASQFYPKNWRPDLNLLVFEEEHEHLKGNIAPISEELLRRNPHVRFFQEKNPKWQHGNELVCIGVFHLGLPFVVMKKAIMKSLGLRPTNAK